MVRRLVLLVALIAGVLAVGTTAASAAPPPPVDAEREFLALLNGERTRANLPALTADPAIVPIAREWSQNMADQNRLYHRPDLRAQVEARVTRDWRRIGENVGRGPDVPGLHTAFMNSPGHRANVLGDYNRVGIAVVNSGSTIWVTFNFLKGPAIAAAPAPAPAPVRPDVPPTQTRPVDAACPAEVPRGTFVDVPASNVHALPIDCVAWWEVAGGVTTKSYVPGAPVNRAQMASFVARALAAAGYSLPAAPADAFGDDEGSVHERAIDQLAAAGIVSGVRPGVFGAGQLVTRAQMATFLVRAHDLLATTDLANVGNRFVDDDGTAHEANINKAAGAGIAGGTAFGYFSPLAEVSRAQVASFLARTLDLLVQDGLAAARAS
jgi:hypothetical protein